MTLDTPYPLHSADGMVERNLYGGLSGIGLNANVFTNYNSGASGCFDTRNPDEMRRLECDFNQGLFNAPFTTRCRLEGKFLASI